MCQCIFIIDFVAIFSAYLGSMSQYVSGSHFASFHIWLTHAGHAKWRHLIWHHFPRAPPPNHLFFYRWYFTFFFFLILFLMGQNSTVFSCHPPLFGFCHMSLSLHRWHELSVFSVFFHPVWVCQLCVFVCVCVCVLWMFWLCVICAGPVLLLKVQHWHK